MLDVRRLGNPACSVKCTVPCQLTCTHLFSLSVAAVAPPLQVEAQCVGQAGCSIGGDLAADPCQGTYKYAKVSYKCAPPGAVRGANRCMPYVPPGTACSKVCSLLALPVGCCTRAGHTVTDGDLACYKVPMVTATSSTLH